MAMSQSSLVFSVRRCEPELVTPAKPTPHEFKHLSDIDDQQFLHFHIPVIQFYSNNNNMLSIEGQDPVRAIREALAQALVFYYPFAGRLREGPGRKLIVDCNSEGVMFIEADADIRLEQFGDALYPPIPCLEELLYNVPGSMGIVNCPLLLIQVTRLMCGGFVIAIHLNHVMSDAAGLIQFLTAVSEIARGAQEPSVKPVWMRELLNARDPPCISFVHREYDEMVNTEGKNPSFIPLDNMVQRSFFLNPEAIAALRQKVPQQLRSCSTFELITACLWRCRTIALQFDPDEQVRIIFPVNTLNKYRPPLPIGFYGNAAAFPAALSTAEALRRNPLGYALELVRKAKGCVTDEYMRSVADLLSVKGRPHITTTGACFVTDLTRVGFGDVDYGWGKAVYGGTTKAGEGNIPGFINHYVSFRNKRGENGILMMICLPDKPSMKRFARELERMTREPTISIGSSL